MGDEYDYGHAGRQTTDTNPVGLAGFIVSLVSIVGCAGLLSPVGLILSLVGCFRQPRSLAIAGVVLGLIGTGGLILMIVVFGVVLIAGAIALIFGASYLGQILATGFDADEIREAIVAYEVAEGRLPSSIDDLTELDKHAANDMWGTPYLLQINPDERTMMITTLGKDKTVSTGDDIRVTLQIDATGGDHSPASEDGAVEESDRTPAADPPAQG